jgi:hypothetical protein
MRVARLAGVSQRKGTITTHRDHDARPAPDLVERNFVADAPNHLWVADITYVPTWAGFLYLSVVLDAWSRRVVGWPMGTTLKTDLVLDALDMALEQRRPDGVIHHSDQGCQGRFYWSSQRLGREGVAMGKRKRRRSDRALRRPMRSPGRPPVWRRENYQRFWVEIARGVSSEEAAATVGVSPAVGVRWFRSSGGISPIRCVPLSEHFFRSWRGDYHPASSKLWDT